QKPRRRYARQQWLDVPYRLKGRQENKTIRLPAILAAEQIHDFDEQCQSRSLKRERPVGAHAESRIQRKPYLVALRRQPHRLRRPREVTDDGEVAADPELAADGQPVGKALEDEHVQ